jgi:CRP-like cAMP-binding protein
MYIVKNGLLRILSGSTMYETVGPGGLIGEMAIVEEHVPRSATVIAGTYAELIEIDMPRFLQLVTSTPNFSIAVMRVISRRLRIMNRRYRSTGRAPAAG